MRARVVPVARLDPATRQAMWALYDRYYESDRATFERDLDGKRDVIVVHDRRRGRLLGFSTLTWWRDEHEDRRFVAVFSGDTVVDRDHWGGAALQRAFGLYLLRLRLRHRRVLWLLTSKGYKTYLLLARNFPRHWPRRDAPTPAWEAGALAHLAARRFGAAWCPEEGVLRHGSEARPARLRDAVAPVGPAEAADPDVAFFVAANPGHADGDELVCIGRFDLRTLPRYLLKRLLRSLAGRRRAGAEGAAGTTGAAQHGGRPERMEQPART